MHDGGVESGFRALVQEHRVEHLARRGVQAERDVGDAQREVHLRVPLVQDPDGLDGLDAVAPHLLLTGGDGEGQRIDDDVRLRYTPVPGDIGDETLGDAYLPLRGPRLTLLVDGQGDHGRAVASHQLHDALEPRARPVAVLVVDRVHRAAAAEVLETGLEHGGLGGVQHDRQRRRRREPRCQCRHVGRTVTSHVVDVEIEHVGAVASLILRDVHALLVVLGDHRLAERLGAVGVGPLTDHEHRRVLVERHRRVERGHPVLRRRGALRPRRVVDRVGDLADVLGGGSAAATHQREPVVGDEPAEVLGQLVGRKGVLRAVRPELRQAGVRHDGHRHRGVLAQVTQMLAHLRRTGGAVQSDHVDPERLDGRQGRPDLAAEQHGAGGLDRDVRDDRDPHAQLLHGGLRAQDRGLDLEQVLAGLDQHGVGTAVDHAERGLGVGIAQRAERGVPERRKLGSRTERAEHEPAHPVPARSHLVGDLAGEGRALVREFPNPIRDVVVGQIREVAAEGVGLHRVRTGLEVRAMDGTQHVGAGVVEDLVAPLEPTEVVQREIRRLQHRAHGAVADDNALVQRIEQA